MHFILLPYRGTPFRKSYNTYVGNVTKQKKLNVLRFTRSAYM